MNNTIITTQTPLGIKIISILFFIISFIFIGLTLFSSAADFYKAKELASQTPELSLPFSFVVYLLILGFVAILPVIFGILLLRRLNWARFSLVIISYFYIVIIFPFTIYDILIKNYYWGIIFVVLAILLLCYLTFNRNVRLAFDAGEVKRATKVFYVITIPVLFFLSFLYIGSDSKTMIPNYSPDEADVFIGNTTYENSHYKFRLTYPENSVIKPTDTRSGYIIRFFLPDGQVIANDTENIGIYIKENTKNLDDYLKVFTNHNSKNGPIDVKEIEMGKRKGYRLIYTSNYTANKGTQEAAYFTIKDDTLFLINYFPVVKDNISSIDDIVQSFEFIQ